MAKKQNGLMAEINKLLSCIESDHNKLAKLYKKAMSDVKKGTATAEKLVAKAKKQITKAKKNKKSAPEAYQSALAQMTSLKQGLAIAKAEQAAIASGNKNLVRFQKLLLKTNKGSLSKVAKKSKKGRPTRKKVDVEAQA